MAPDRRALLLALAAGSALGLAGCATPQASPPLDAAAFGVLSSTLTGYRQLDADAVQRMRAAFDTPPRRAALARLARLAQVVRDTPAADLDAALKAQRLDAIARALVAAWYSGVVDGPGGAQDATLVLYTDALVWDAMAYVGPMGQCRGETGHWARPPQT